MAQSTVPRTPVSSKSRQRARRRTRAPLSSVFTLARWQLRQTWQLLIVIGIGLLVAVVLVCAIPLYAQVAMSAGLRHTLNSDPSNLSIKVHATSSLFSSEATQETQQQLTSLVQSDMGSQVNSNPALSVQISTLTVATNEFVRLAGTDVAHAKAHVKLLQGRLPVASSGDTIEFAMIQQGAHDLGFKLGQIIQLPYPVYNPRATPPQIKHYLKLQLVGIIAPTNGNDLFWHGETFLPEAYSVGLSTVERIPLLVANSELEDVLDQLSQAASVNNQSVQLSTPPDVYWYYNFDFSHLDINQLPHMIVSLNSLLTSVTNYPEFSPYIVGTTALGPLSVLQSYSDRITVLELPTLCLAYLIAGLVLFFIFLMTDMLVERQVESITLLRSRGAAARQVFGSLLGQSIGLGLIAFLAGPLLAILLVIALVNLTVAAADRSALNLITDNPLAAAQGQIERDLLVVGIAVLAMAFSIWRVLRTNILTFRREQARSTRQPLWMRFKLDILAALIAIVGFAFSQYLESSGVLDVRTRTLILPLTTVVGVLFLLLGCLLLFLRLFPAVLRLGERLAARKRGAAPILALAQMARSPRQPLRMTLLFALAVAFALFTLIFSQTQAQRLTNITTYQVGGDFSGTIPDVLSDDDWGNQLAFYRSIKGITSVTLGTTEIMEGGSDESIAIDLQAVDTSTYANTIYWSSQYSSQPISQLTGKLQSLQVQAERQNLIPAVIDDAAAQSLGVGVGQHFVLADYHGPMNYLVVGVVHYFPTVYDTTGGTGSDTSIPLGGVLVDYQTYSTVALAVNQNGISATQVWLRVNTQPADLASARSVLFSGTYELDDGIDRFVLAQTLATDPLYDSLIGILVLGALVALLLGFLGNLLVAWWNARSRRTSFAVLRALGCDPAQITAVLFWEQGIVYGAALLLGIVLSVLLALVVLPVFIFSPLVGESTAEAFYIAQSVPVVHPAFPLLPILGMLAVLIAICVLSLVMMVRIVTGKRMDQTLRGNED
jgi:hypothetical protein